MNALLSYEAATNSKEERLVINTAREHDRQYLINELFALALENYGKQFKVESAGQAERKHIAENLNIISTAPKALPARFISGALQNIGGLLVADEKTGLSMEPTPDNPSSFAIFSEPIEQYKTIYQPANSKTLDLIEKLNIDAYAYQVQPQDNEWGGVEHLSLGKYDSSGKYLPLVTVL